MATAKPFEIPKALVWQAYKKVKANGGAPGVDGVTLKLFGAKLGENLYKIWNRMSSGSYLPPPVKAVEIPKKTGGVRVLGIPTVGDRIAQATVSLLLERELEPVFDADSYGYRPGKSAHQALEQVRKRCWKYDWVVEFDIKGMFDNIDHQRLLKALTHHVRTPWVVLYVKRWLIAPLELSNGTVVPRSKGTPQGGVVSPILANLFMHYAFDAWMRREFFNVPFCRYADDGLLHCRTEQQAQFLLERITERFSEVGLEIHPLKSKIVYCKDRNRAGQWKTVSFDFLGYTFRPRRCVDKKGVVHPNFLPAVSPSAKKAMNQEIRRWEISLKSAKEIDDLAKMFNPALQGWANYYGRYYPTAMQPIWRNLNAHLIKWVRRKYKDFATQKRKAWRFLAKLASERPKLFVHWRLGVLPNGSSVGAG